MMQKELQQALVKAAVLSERLQEQAYRADMRQQQATAAIEAGLRNMDETVGAAIGRHVAEIRSDVAREVLEGSRQSVAQFASELEDLKKHMMDFASFAADMERRMEKKSKLLSMRLLLPAALLAASMLAVIIAAVWLGTHYRGIINNSKIEAEALQHYEQSSLYLCGGQHLCAKTMKTPEPFRKQGYVFIAPKAAQSE